MSDATQNLNSVATAFRKIDFNAIIARVKEIIFNPNSSWAKIKDEQTSIKQIYQQYLIPLAALPALGHFIGTSIVGVTIPFLGTWRAPFFGGLVAAVISYALTLGMIYLAAHIINFLAPKFNAQADLTSSFKLIAYSLTPSFIAGVLAIIPGLFLIRLILSLYGLYLFYLGLSHLTTVSEERKKAFFGASILSLVVTMLIVGLIMSSVSPMPNTRSMKQVAPGTIDLEKLQKGMEELQKALPNNGR